MSRPRSDSHSRTRSGPTTTTTIPSRPTTPLRPPSRTSLRASQTTPSYAYHAGAASTTTDLGPHHDDHQHLTALSALEPQFAELSDSMADLEANFMHLQLLNESLSRFTENFGAFLYGMNMSAFCVDFPEAPIPASHTLHSKSTTTTSANFLQQNSPFRTATASAAHNNPNTADATFLTSDTSFVENPPASTSKFSSSVGGGAAGTRGRGAVGGRGTGRAGTAAGRGGARGGAGGAAGRGVGRGSGIARGVGSQRRGTR